MPLADTWVMVILQYVLVNSQLKYCLALGTELQEISGALGENRNRPTTVTLISFLENMMHEESMEGLKLKRREREKRVHMTDMAATFKHIIGNHKD